MKTGKKKIKVALEKHEGIYVDTVFYVQPNPDAKFYPKSGGYVFQPDNAEVDVYLGLNLADALQRAEQGPPF